MNNEEFKENLKQKAAALGKKALKVGKAVGEYGLQAGKEIAKEAVIAGRGLTSDLEVAAIKMDENSVNNARWDKLQGVWHSKKIFPEAFEDVQTQLRNPIGAHRLNVIADSSICRITGESSWNEDIPGYPNSYHQINLQLDFKPDGTGTEVQYVWILTDFPKGLFARKHIRIVNSWLEAVLEGEEPVVDPPA